jgi:hypothetical protein
VKYFKFEVFFNFDKCSDFKRKYKQKRKTYFLKKKRNNRKKKQKKKNELPDARPRPS